MSCEESRSDHRRPPTNRLAIGRSLSRPLQHPWIIRTAPAVEEVVKKDKRPVSPPSCRTFVQVTHSYNNPARQFISSHIHMLHRPP